MPLPVYSKDNAKIGQIASGIYSPRFKKNCKCLRKFEKLEIEKNYNLKKLEKN